MFCISSTSEVNVKGQSTSLQPRVGEADRERGIADGWAWINKVNSLGDYPEIAKLPRAPIGMDFIGKESGNDSEEALEQARKDRQEVRWALERHGHAESLVFLDDVIPELEKLKDEGEPEARARIILAVLQRSLDVPHPYINDGWRTLEGEYEIDRGKLCAELRQFTSSSHSLGEGNICQVAHLI